MKYLVVIEKTEAGYSAFSPDLPGCVATGATKQEAQDNIRGAIAFHLEGMQEQGMKPPQPQSWSTYLEVPA